MFAPELSAMTDEASRATLAAADVLTGFEAFQLLTVDREFGHDEVRAVLLATLTTLLAPGAGR